MSDPTIVDGEGSARGARAAVARLAPEFGVGLPVDVEAALHTPTGVGGDRYLDPIALAALIVSAAQLVGVCGSAEEDRAAGAAGGGPPGAGGAGRAYGKSPRGCGIG